VPLEQRVRTGRLTAVGAGCLIAAATQVPAQQPPPAPVLSLSAAVATSDVPFTLTAALTASPGSASGRSSSRSSGTGTSSGTSPGAPSGTALKGRTIIIQVRARDGWRTIGTPVTDARGAAVVRTTTWWGDTFRAVFLGEDRLARATSAAREVRAAPASPPVARPGGAPAPATERPSAPRAVGPGANAVVRALPDAVWAGMQGRTWHPGCVGRNQLRYVQVNYFGFDGYRHRGELVVRSDVAAQAAAAFGELYAARYPIRLMVLPDRFGRNPRGPGANDYASMAADNTSGFNCRYVVAKESGHVPSPHAGGRAIDVNPWENPYSSPGAPGASRWYLGHRPASPPVLRAGDAATRALTRRGWSWGGSWSTKDYQHFER